MASPPDTQTVVATAVFIDLVGFSKIPTSAQLTIKQRLKQVLDGVVGRMQRTDFWVRDLGDGALLVFPQSPEHGLYVALAVNQRFAEASAGAEVPAQTRTGIHLGVIKTSIDLEGRVNFLGDGLNAAQRVMDFAQPGQIMASRTYVDAVGMLHADIEHLFSNPQTRKDKHGRAHEVYEAGFSQPLLERLEAEATQPGKPATPAATAPAPAARPARGRLWALAGVAALAVTAVATVLAGRLAPAERAPAPTPTNAQPPAAAPAPGPTQTATASAPAPATARETTPPPKAAPAARPAPSARAEPAPARANNARPATVLAATTPAERASCTAILNKTALGAPLSAAERKVLMDTCQ